MRHEIDILDTEYCTPAQAAEIRRMKAELPLWIQVEAMKGAAIDDVIEGSLLLAGGTFNVEDPFNAWLANDLAKNPRSDVVTNDATDNATQALDGLETTIDSSNGQSSINAPSNVPSEFSPDNMQMPDVVYFGAINYDGPSSGRLAWNDFMADVELHRALNGTTGDESEE